MSDLVERLQSWELLARNPEYPNNNTKADDIREAIDRIEELESRVKELDDIERLFGEMQKCEGGRPYVRGRSCAFCKSQSPHVVGECMASAESN